MESLAKIRLSILILCAIVILFCACNNVPQPDVIEPTPMQQSNPVQASPTPDNRDWNAEIDLYERAIEDNPRDAASYMALADVYVALQQKEDALQTLKNGILILGGSKAAEAEPLVKQWWNTLLQVGDGTEQVLTEEEIRQVDIIAYNLVKNAGGYMFPNELWIGGYGEIVDNFCCEFITYASESGRYAVAPELYPVELLGSEYVVAVTSKTADKLLMDVIGDTVPDMIQNYKEEMYYSRGGKESYYKWVCDYAIDYAELDANKDKEQIEVLITRIDEIIFDPNILPIVYYDQDPYTLARYQQHQYLGDDTFYVIFQGWKEIYDSEGEIEDYEETRDMMHYIVQRADTIWGFRIIARPATYGTFIPPIQADWAMPDGLTTDINDMISTD